MPRVRGPTHKQLSFARRCVAGDSPLQAVINSDYDTDGFKDDNGRRAFAHELLAHPLVAAAITRANEERMHGASMSRQEILDRYINIARGSFGDLVEWETIEIRDDTTGEVLKRQRAFTIKDSDDLTDDDMALIKEMSVTESGKITIKLYDGNDAAKALRQMDGLDHAPKATIGQDGDDVPGVQLIAVSRTVIAAPDET